MRKLGILNIFLAGLLGIVILFSEWVALWPSNPQNSVITKFFQSWGYPLGIVLATFVFILSIVNGWRDNQGRKDYISRYLRHIHISIFPHEEGRNPWIRFSYWVPTRKTPSFPWWSIKKRHLKCIYRTDGYSTNALWSSERPKDGRDWDGLAACTFLTGTNQNFDELPDYSSGEDEDRVKYCRETHITEVQAQARSWLARSFRTHLVRGSRQDPVGVLMIEGEAPNSLVSLDRDTFWEIGMFVSELGQV